MRDDERTPAAGTESVQRPRLGALLVEAGLITDAVLESALEKQHADGGRLGEILVDRGCLSDTQLAQALSMQLSIPCVAPLRLSYDVALLLKAGEGLARELSAVPVMAEQSADGAYCMALTPDPTDARILSRLSDALAMPVRPLIAPVADIRIVIDDVYARLASAQAEGAAEIQVSPRQRRLSKARSASKAVEPPVEAPAPRAQRAAGITLLDGTVLPLGAASGAQKVDPEAERLRVALGFAKEPAVKGVLLLAAALRRRGLLESDEIEALVDALNRS